VDLGYEPAAVAFTADGKALATAGVRKPVRLWDAMTGKEIRSFEGHEGRTFSVAVSPDGKTLASAGGGPALPLWGIDSGKEMARLTGHRNEIHAVAFSPDGKKVVSAAEDETVRVWDVASASQVAQFESTPGLQRIGVIAWVQFTDDGKTVALGRSDRT